MDFNFRQTVDANNNLSVNPNVKDHPEFLNGNDNGTYWVDNIYNAHVAAKKYADEHDIKIYNATRGGKLEVFPRVDFDSLF